MPFKINISEKTGKTYKIEVENEELQGKELGEIIEGKDLSPELSGYKFEICGASDKAGFPSFKEVEGSALKGVLLTYGKGMHKKPKGLKKFSTKPKGLRLRKTVRGKTLSQDIIQINLKVVESGGKILSEVFPEQNQKKEEKPTEIKA
jgi:small subunit ribosomal protein S6e